MSSPACDECVATAAIDRRAASAGDEHDCRLHERVSSELETVSCPLCDGGRWEPLVETPDFATGLGGIFRVVRCVACGLAFTNPRPSPSSIGHFYPLDYPPHEGHRQDNSLRGRVRRKLERCVLRHDYNYPPQPAGVACTLLASLGRLLIRGRRRRAAWISFRGDGRLLDFGCGAAAFARQAKEYGWSVEGLDASHAVAERVEREAGFRVHVGTLPHADVVPRSFDAITMWASLEHVHDPHGVVRAARDALRPGGTLLVSVPNIASWPARTFRHAWWGLELPRHLIHFTPATLTRLLESEGLHIRRLEHVGRDGWLRRSAERARELDLEPSWLRACRWKPPALAISRWTERSQQAENIVAVAERL